MSSSPIDPVIRRLREQISESDRSLLRAFNRRLELVAELKRHKESLGIPFVDPEREELLLRQLSETNEGPLSPEGLRELFGTVLELTKRQLGRGS